MKNIDMPTNRTSPSVRPTDMPIIAPVDKELLLEDEGELEGGAAVAAAVEVAAVLVEDEPGTGGDMLNAGEKCTLLELESSRILNLYCCVVGRSEGMSNVALPVFVSMAVQRVNLSVTFQKRRLG